MISLYDSEIKEILPDVLSTQPEVRAISYAINMALRRLLTYCKSTGVYSSIDELGEEVLDLLAIEFDALYYDMSLPLANKRKIIKDTLPQYLRSGTVGAVEDLITTIFGGGEIEEWFDYEGTPGHFRLFVDITDSADNPVSEMDETAMEEKLERVKKYSQHLDSFSWMIKHTIEIKKKIEQWACMVPECGMLYCGTYWMPATRGYTDKDGINIQARPELYENDQPEVGTLPVVSTLGYSVNGTEEVDAAVDAYNDDSAECGEEETGTLPRVATLGYSANNQIDIWNSKVKAYNSEYALCGVVICGETD